MEAQNQAALEDSLVGQGILGFIGEDHRWEGMTSELLRTLEEHAEELQINVKDKAWPKAANMLSRRLRELAPNLRRLWISIEEKKAHGVVRWELARGVPGNTPPIATIATLQAKSPLSEGVKQSPPITSISPSSIGISPPVGAASSFAGGDGRDSRDISPTPMAWGQDAEDDHWEDLQ